MVECLYMSQPSIQVENLGKCFRYYNNKWQRLRGLLAGSSNHAQEIWALRKLNFALQPGTTLGIIGANGSGKTTLLQLMAGLMKPTEGSVHVEGRLATLLELGSAFQHELTGRENIFASAGLRGFSRREINGKLEEIIHFSELEEFIDHPVKHYSSGMTMRLAFATAINVEPEVLLIDEVFSVGDMAFAHKCVRKFRQLQAKGVTIVLVTHDMIAVKSFCNRALLLDRGKQILFGSPEEVTNRYLSLVAEKIAKEDPLPPAEENVSISEVDIVEFPAGLPETPKMHSHGSGQGRIRGIQILNSKLDRVQRISFGEEVTFRFFLEYCADVPVSGLGFYIRDRYGNDIVGINTFEEQTPLGTRKKGDRLIVDFKLPLYFAAGSYSVSPGFSYDPSEPRYLEWIDNAVFFEMEKPLSGKQIYGFAYIPNQVSVQLVK